MKKILIMLFMASSLLVSKAQNLQLHYDFGEGRKYLTSTVEMFKPDKYGSTFFFIDMDYGVSDNLKGVNMAYWEIARGLKFWDNPFEIHLEYNGGLGLFGAEPSIGGYNIASAYLIGGNYTFASADFSKILTLQAMYKYIQDVEDASFQITGVWTLNFFNNKFTCSGFADFWKEKKPFGTDFVFLAEPQFWYNATKKFSVGSEIELANNFLKPEFTICPTLGVKWTF